jgi:hypothetical protein
VIRWLSKRAIPESSWTRAVLHPDPDVLLGYGEQRSAADTRSRDDTHAFSELVSSIRVGKTHKLTRPNRLEIPTRALCRVVTPSADRPFALLDVGGSDGVTTQDAVRALEERLQQPVAACLIDPFVRLRRFRSGPVVEYRTPDQSPVMVRVGRIGLQLSSLDTSRDLVSRPLGEWYLRRHAFRKAMPLDATIALVNPAVAADPRIEVREWDVLQYDPSLDDRFHAVRASNVLNRSYFSAAQIIGALANLHAYLREDGLLLISRSLEEGGRETDHGTIWIRRPDRFSRIDAFGSGSEVADLVEPFRANPRAGSARRASRAAELLR